MITNVAAWVMQIIVCHHLLKKWWEKVEQSWQLSGWISTPLCVVVGISIEVSDHCNADSTIITFISGKPHLRDVVILSWVQPTNHHDDEECSPFQNWRRACRSSFPGCRRWSLLRASTRRSVPRYQFHLHDTTMMMMMMMLNTETPLSVYYMKDEMWRWMK